MNIFVAKLSFDTQGDDLRHMFEQYGVVNSVKIITDRDTGRSKGFGFVEMEDDTDANEAINNLNGVELDERTIVVKKAEPRGPNGRDGGGHNRRGGGGYGGGGGGGHYGGGGGYNTNRRY